MSGHDHTWRSADGRFGVQIANDHLVRMLRWCQRAGLNETGGILVGYYAATLDRAVITQISSAPRDSRQGRAWFLRGTQNLQSWLDRLWRAEHHYYLGEWHYHPFSISYPSASDQEQMRRIAQDVGYHCPEPILFIVGGDPSGLWQVRIFVTSNDHHLIELYPENSISSAGILPGIQSTNDVADQSENTQSCQTEADEVERDSIP
jgi:integrative and conjugative element protein (TIGR02256 family)